jgi:5-methylcytosine-specific restriction endonuclease McrA
MSTGIEWTDESLKYCWRCRRDRTRSLFGKDRTRYDGRAAICRSCRKPPKQLPLIRRTRSEYERARYASDVAYRAERRARVHARKRGLETMPVDGMEAVSERFGGRCAYCPARATTWDHIVPVSKGGRTEPGNMLPACMSCNSRKNALDIEEFIERYDVHISTELEAAIALALEWGQLVA